MTPNNEQSSKFPSLPKEKVDKFAGPLQKFLHIEAASGVILLVFTIIALVLANSQWSAQYLAFWNIPFGFQFGDFKSVHSLKHWINDGLMAVFFFVIGLEVKRELVIGELREFRKAILPIIAAIGGMVVPAGVYLLLQQGEPTARGWGIPMATDIAFVVGCLAILGKRIPRGLRVMLLTLAIVDDIGAILVIAIGYTDQINLDMLLLGCAGILITVALAKLGVRSVAIYFVCGALVWACFHRSGVHATIAGVILGLLTPTKCWVSDDLLKDIFRKTYEFFSGKGTQTPAHRYAVLRHAEKAARESISPVERLQTVLHPWVGFVIMPVFALANAGVPIELAMFGEPLSIAIVCGLLVGKPIGIVGFSLVAIWFKWTKLPEGVSWMMLSAGGILAGIGFTMSLFIADLALDDLYLNTAKIGILGGSFIAATLGMIILILSAKNKGKSL